MNKENDYLYKALTEGGHLLYKLEYKDKVFEVRREIDKYIREYIIEKDIRDEEIEKQLYLKMKSVGGR